VRREDDEGKRSEEAIGSERRDGGRTEGNDRGKKEDKNREKRKVLHCHFSYIFAVCRLHYVR